MGTIETMKKTLREYLTEYKSLENQNNLLEKQADAQKSEFVSERHAGMKGKLPSTLFPTLQDLTIYMFYGSIITLFTIMGSTSSILSVGGSSLPQYVFIFGVITTFITSFYSTRLTFVLLCAVLVYFIRMGYKPFLFFVSFLLTMALTMIMVNSTL